MTGLVYLDASAIVKLVVEESESAPLRAALAGRPARVSSALALVEVHLAAARRSPAPPPERVEAVLAGITLLPVDLAVLRAAAGLRAANVRALDAVHLATARSVSAELDALVAYDRRLLAAATAAALPVEQPS